MTAEPKFHRWVDPAIREAGRAQSIDASEAERIALAAWLDIPVIHALHAEIQVKRTGTESAEVTGTFSADVELVCGVSLDPFSQRISGEFVQEYRKPHGLGPHRSLDSPSEIDLSLDEDEPGEWRPEGIDLGALLAEELSLALPDFPRKPDAALEPLPDAPADDARPNPFAALSRLKGGEG